MAKYAIVKNGRVVNVVVADFQLQPDWIDLTGVEPQPSKGWFYDGTDFTQGEFSKDLGSKITPRAFLKRFPAQARKQATARSKSNVDVEDFFLLLRLSQYVDLNDSDVSDALSLLQSLNILTQAEVDAILNDPVQENELP